MPLFEYQCEDCGKTTEYLLTRSDDEPVCGSCGGKNLKKLLSAHSSASGLGGGHSMPGPGDTACCGSTPGQATGCAGPGSCCGRTG